MEGCPREKTNLKEERRRHSGKESRWEHTYLTQQITAFKDPEEGWRRTLLWDKPILICHIQLFLVLGTQGLEAGRKGLDYLELKNESSSGLRRNLQAVKDCCQACCIIFLSGYELWSERRKQSEWWGKGEWTDTGSFLQEDKWFQVLISRPDNFFLCVGFHDKSHGILLPIGLAVRVSSFHQKGKWGTILWSLEDENENVRQ